MTEKRENIKAVAFVVYLAREAFRGRFSFLIALVKM